MKNYIKELIPYIVIIIAVLLIRTFIMTPVNVDGDSMNNTLYNGDIMILKKLDKNYERNEIVVFKRNNDRLIKRVIALPGEKVKCVSGIIYVDNVEYEDKFANGKTGDFEEVKLDSNEYFVLGDNRGNSLDSRFFGPVREDQILGTTNLIIFPFNRIRKL